MAAYHDHSVRPAQGQPRTAAFALFAAAVLLVECSKGFLDQLQLWGYPYWWLDYGDGMVRRGLAGQLFQSVFGVLSPQDLRIPVLSLHLAAVTALAVIVALLFGRAMARLRGTDRLVFAGLAVWILVSQFWPTTTYNTGYLDVWVLLMAALAVLALRQGWIWAAAALMVAGPLVHEYFLFLTPFVLASAWRDQPKAAPTDGLLPLDAAYLGPRPGAFLLLFGLAVGASAAVILLSSPEAAQAQVAGMEMSAQDKNILLVTTLGQGAGGAMARMMELMSANVLQTIGNALFFLAPAAAACIGIVFWRAPRRTLTPWIQAAAAMFPIAALLIAWDLSRLLVMTNFTAGMTLLVLAQDRTADER